MILIIKHIDIEGPGTLGDFLDSQGEACCTLELGAGEPLPVDAKAYKAVVVLGGPMNVYEEDRYPFLKSENEFIQKVLRQEIPFLGICLGAQLLAKAAGAQVVRSPVKEIGWYRVEFTPEGRKDPLLEGFCPQRAGRNRPQVGRKRRAAQIIRVGRPWPGRKTASRRLLQHPDECGGSLRQ